MEKTLDMTLQEVRDLLRKREATAVDLTQFYLERIRKHDGVVNAYLRLTEEQALEMAADADRKIGKGEDSPLLGVPFGIKDIFCTKGIETNVRISDTQRFCAAL